MFFLLCILFFFQTHAQNNLHQLKLHLNDSVYLITPILLEQSKITVPAYPKSIQNTADIELKKDSLSFSISIYENRFLLKKQSPRFISGTWIKYSSGNKQYKIPVTIEKTTPHSNIDIQKMKDFPSKWKIKIQAQNKVYDAAGTFQFYSNASLPHITGSIATPYGDLGNMNGYLTQDSLFLSVFNGSFATQIYSKVFYNHLSDKADSLKGYIYYGNWDVEKFTAMPDKNIDLKNEIPLQSIFSDTAFTLHHTWTDIDGKVIRIDTNKAIVIQMMGTWCPNCADESKLFSEWYKNLFPNVQIIALAVERTYDAQKAIALLKQYKEKLNIPYPVVLLSDKNNASSFHLFPELLKIPAFPTTVYFNKQHTPIRATIGFCGPSTQDLYIKTQENIQKNIQKILE